MASFTYWCKRFCSRPTRQGSFSLQTTFQFLKKFFTFKTDSDVLIFWTVQILCKSDFWSLILEGLAILHKYTIEEIVGFLQEVHTDFPLNPHLCDLQYQSATELHLYLPIVFFIQQFFHSRSCVGIICGSRSKCVSGNLWQADKASAL